MNDKSIVDVLDNTVNQLSNGVQVLGNAIAKVAPDAWKILVHQQKMLAVEDIIYGFLFIIGILISLILYKKIIYNAFIIAISKDSDYIVGQVVCGILITVITFILSILSAIHLCDGFVKYNSAEYYAAKDALGLVK